MGHPEPISTSTDFIAVSVAVLKQIAGPLPFDVYVQRTTEAHTRLFPKGEVMDQSRLDQYQQNKGVESLYITQTDFTKYQGYVDRIFAALRMEMETMSEAEVAEHLINAIDVVTLELFANCKVDERTLAQTNLLIKGCVDALNHKPGVLAKLVKFVNFHPYLMKHSVMTSLFAVLLAKADGITASRNLEVVGMGGLLHDLGMSRVSFDEESKQDLTPEEWKELKQHPEQGKKLLDAVPSLSSEVKLIVLQHHEQINGAGYPNGLVGGSIFRLVKIVTIADVFSSLITKRSYREEFKPAVAIETMLEDKGKFDEELVCKLAELLGLSKTRRS